MKKLRRILALVLIACMILGMIPAMSAAAADEESKPLFMEITSGNYLSTVGSNAFNVFMYDNTFSGTFGDQHMGGIELALNNLRIATNGDLHMLPTPEQWDATPAPSKGSVIRDKETQTITVPMTFSGSPDGTLKYNLVAYPTEDSLVLEMVLQSDMPADLQGKARFNLEFLPSAYQNKTYQTDLNGDGSYDTYGIFPLHAQDAMVDTERPNLPSQTWYVKDWNVQRGNAQPVPFATGLGFAFAQEDSDVAINISSNTDAKLELLDGRNRAQNGWYVLSTLITATKAGEVAVSWNIKPNVEEGWVKEPLVTFSQVGYAPSQEEKFAVVELDKWDNDYPKDISLWRVNADGSEDMVCEKELGETSAWQRFKYARFDFSEVNEIGLYRIHYNGEVTEVFPIAEDAYDNIWQTTLDGFLAVQMDHIEVREGYKIWHGASHMDDCYLNPTSSSGWYQGKSGWFDGMGVGSFPAKLTEAGFAPDTHVDGLNKGGWFDAGDFDLQMSRNFSVLNDIINAAEYCGNMDNYDNLYVEWNDATGGLVEMHRPDGVPDVIQQAIHGSKQQLAQYEVLGGCGGCMEVRYLRQYTHLGDPSSDTDGYIYDPELAEGDVVERDGKVYSGVDDDRFLLFSGGGGSFSTSMSGRANNFAGVAYLAAPYYPDYAAEIFNAATKIWKDENLGNNPAFDRVVQYTLAAFNLEKYGIAYNDQDTLNYAFFKGLLDERLEAAINGGVNSNMALLALIPVAEEMGLGEDFKDRLEPSVASVAASQSVNSNVFGLNPSTGASWGGSPNSYSGVRNISFMLYNFPNVEGHEKMEKNILRSVNYLLGRHPASNASWISGVGTKSSLHPYNSNRAEESYIPGSILPGHITFNDFVETMGDHFNFLWFENESIINYQSSWLPVGLVAGKIGHKVAEEVAYAPTKDFESSFDAELKTVTSSSMWGGGSTDGYFTDGGFDVLMYSTTFDRTFGDQHCAGIELVQDGRRVATNGDIHLLPTPEQWDATPPPTRGTRTFAEDNITVNMTIPAETFTDGTPENPAVNYQLIAEPEEGGIKLTVKLGEPLPADLIGKAGFNLEFLPAVYMEKSFMADSDGDGTYDSFGVFPRDPSAEMEDVARARTNNQVWYVQEWNEDRGDAQPLPFATGTKMTFAAEDDDYRIRISSEDGLALYDGRNRAQNGWYVLRTLIPEGATEIVWHISPDVDQSWTREPNISHSQVGYEPALTKVAVIELDPNYEGGNTATLKRLNGDGSYTDVFTAELGEAKTWKRYIYRDFDFSEVQETGTYVIVYDGFVSDPFPIDKHVYEDIWQRSASNYLAVQMDHMRIREGYKIWRNAAHMDDALQAPKNMSWFDGWSMGGTVESGYDDYEYIPGLAVGGFCDAGDFDIQIGSNLTLINNIALAYEAYGSDYDTLDCNWETRNVELNRPDGIPDLVELAKHGSLQIAAELDQVGFLASVIEVPSLRQYTHLGDGSKDTDNLLYDATLGEDEVEGRRSGKRDDRLAFFTTKSISSNANGAAAIANTAAILKDYDPETAAAFIATAEKVWNDPELSHEGTEGASSWFGPSGPADWALAIALYNATGKDVYKDRIVECFDSRMSTESTGGGWFASSPAFGSDGWKVVTVLDQLGEEYEAKFKAALTAYAPSMGAANASNPYGVSDTMGMWGGSDGVVGGATMSAVLATYYPDIVNTEPVFRAVNYILGTHPCNSTSWVSSVGYNSVEKGYGSNRADNYYIAGGLVPGYVTVAPDLPEHMDDFNFLWFENEYTAPVTADWILLSAGVEALARNTDTECVHNYTAKVTAPNCTKGGYTTYFCENCFDTYIDDYTDALGHDYDEGRITKQALATFDGIKTYTCKRCGITYDEVVPAPGTCDMSDIDFTLADSINRVVIDNQTNAKVNEGTGLYLQSSSGSNESGTAQDLIKVPVKGDWTATMKYTYEGKPSSGSSWFKVTQNFVFLAMDDYKNAVGIRTNDNNLIQDYKRIDGTTASAANAASVTLEESTPYWFRIVKEGDDYTCFWSTDGEEFTELFKFEDTGIEARCLDIDAYTTGSSWGSSSTFKYNVEFIDFETPAPVGNPGLKDAFADYFRIGTCVGTREVQTEAAQEFIKKNFNSVTCENEMKPQYTLDQAASQAEGNNVEVKVQLQDSTRAILDFCDANNIPMRMHVICWHSQTPTWLFREGFTNDGEFVSEEIMDQRLESYIKNLFALVKQEYPNLTFYAVDVVNEAFTDDNPAVMRSPSLSGWIAVYGNSTKFIYKAFEYAQKYKPEGCMLCYNDYNEYNPGKLEAIAEMCKDLYEKGLLDAIGMQSHLTVDNNPSMETYRKALATYAAIGCPIMITELDAQENAGGDEAQADYYGELFEILVEYASQIESVTFWGTNDNNSWRSSSHPLAFVNYEPKEAYYSILDAVSDHEHEYEVTVTPPTCTEPGYSTRVCSICGRTRVFDRTAATGHIWDDGVVTTEATEEADGVKTFTCTVCGETKTARIPRIGTKVPADIDFSDPADAEKYEIVNQASSTIVANEGLSLVSTTNSSPEAAGEAFNPSDLISIPVGGNFSATLKFQKSGGSAFSFFGDTDLLGFYLADDNDNFVGIRAGNRSLVNLVKKNGVVTTANAAIGASTATGLNAAGTLWFKLEKSGDNVTASWSTDGENFTEIFAFESTGLVGEKLIIDAYNTSMWSFGGSNSYILETLNFNEIEGTEYKLGPVVVADPGSPTGYVGKFYYFDDEAEQVYFCGDLMLSYTDDPGRNAEVFSPFDYKPGMMRRGGSQFKEPMKALGDGYWYYELPLTAGANQYWFNTESNTRMIPDPANHPQWSPASNWDTKNAYNAIYVPYDEKQGNEVLKAREIENPREGQNNGTWSYVPYKLSEEQASDYYMGVYLPYGYDADRAEPYKTIYVLHGGGQDESDWLGIGSVQNIIDNLYADGRIEDAPVLIVPRNTRLGSGSLEATFAFVEKNYNVSTDRMDRAICGLSMGGMMINSLLNDDKKREGPTFGYYGFFSGGNPSNALNSPYLLDSYYYVGSGLYEGNPYNQALVDTGAPYHFTQFAGAHDFNTWCQMFTDFAENYAFQPNAFTKKEVPFKDVNPGTYYYDAVKWAVDNGITNGFEPGLFAPDNTVTRAQIVTMLWRAAGCPIVETAAGFKDVKASAYYYDAVAWAVAEGITNGVGKNKFAPDDTCTRGQIVTFLWRYVGKPAAEAAAEFTDVPADEYYADAVAWAVEAGVTEGYPDGTFLPVNDCTRAQAVTFLQRALAE